MKSRITQSLGVRYPIMQGDMQWVRRAELASAVSSAGGPGKITALAQPTPPKLVQEIARCRTMTGKPFSVNLPTRPSIKPPYAEYVEALLDAGVDIVETAGNTPLALVERMKSRSIRIPYKCTPVRHALSAQKRGVDVISIDGFKCAEVRAVVL